MYLSTRILILLPFIFATVGAMPTKAGIAAKGIFPFIRTSAPGSFQFGECPVTNASPSLGDTSPQLPAASQGLKPIYVTLGRGTQNYTCSSSDASATPTAVGAVATLFDASCIASSFPKLLDQIPPLLEQIPVDTLTSAATTVSNGKSLAIGKHYFQNTTTPFFDFRGSGLTDWMAGKKNASVNAPTATSGVSSDVDTAAVPWLQLGYEAGVGIKEVYRIVTAGGSPPATCEGQAASFEIQYAAQYWFYG